MAGGLRFALAYTARQNVAAIAAPDAANLYVLENPCWNQGCGASVLVKSTDGARTFVTVHTFPDFSANAMSFVGPEVGFVVVAPVDESGNTGSGVLERTTDGGEHWTSLSEPMLACAGGDVESIDIQFPGQTDGWALCGGQHVRTGRTGFGLRRH